MAFQSGITTSPNDLLDKIRLFATGSCGYTQLMYQADAGYYRLHLQHAASGQLVIHAFLHAGYVAWYGSTSFNRTGLQFAEYVVSGSFSPDVDVGSASTSSSAATAGCYCVVQTASTTYAPIIFGAIARRTFTGGAFLSDTYSTYVRPTSTATPRMEGGHLGRRCRARLHSATTRQLDSYSPIAFNG